jgi:hypothetical protein
MEWGFGEDMNILQEDYHRPWTNEVVWTEHNTTQQVDLSKYHWSPHNPVAWMWGILLTPLKLVDCEVTNKGTILGFVRPNLHI